MNEEEESHWFLGTWQEPIGMKGMELGGRPPPSLKKKNRKRKKKKEKTRLWPDY